VILSAASPSLLGQDLLRLWSRAGSSLNGSELRAAGPHA
jgi:hypothetical protein